MSLVSLLTIQQPCSGTAAVFFIHTETFTVAADKLQISSDYNFCPVQKQANNKKPLIMRDSGMVSTQVEQA